MRTYPALATAAFFAALVCLPLAGANHALLIGVGEYKNFPAAKLDGPPHDVRVLRDKLVGRWGFPAENVRTLVDQQATRAAILHQLEDLTNRLRPGDQAFLYFSGHGTSAFDPKSGSLCADVNSGCLIPHDVLSGTPLQVVNSLLLGSRDIRPRLEAMEAKQPARVFVVFDSCFSENAAKSVRTGTGESREIPLSSLVRAGVLADEYDAAYATVRQPSRQDTSYPYRNVISLSAAAKDEKALDIPQWKLTAREAQTLDGKPHGRFTDALLRGLEGLADQNGDGRISFGELYGFTLSEMQGVQTPQLKTPPGGREGVLFGAQAPVAETGRVAASGLPEMVRVRLERAEGLRQPIAGLAGVTVSAGAADFTVTGGRNGYVLRLGNGLLLREYQTAEAAELVQRIGAEPRLRRVMNWRKPNGKDTLELRLSPEDRGVFRVGEQFEFLLRADREMYFVLLNVDTAGVVSVVYPPTGERGPARERRVVSTITGPATGAEQMKLFAFKERPAGYERWGGLVLEPADKRGEALFAAMEGAAAESSLILYSSKE